MSDESVIRGLARRMERGTQDEGAMLEALVERYGFDKAHDLWWAACDLYDERHREEA